MILKFAETFSRRIYFLRAGDHLGGGAELPGGRNPVGAVPTFLYLDCGGAYRGLSNVRTPGTAP